MLCQLSYWPKRGGGLAPAVVSVEAAGPPGEAGRFSGGAAGYLVMDTTRPAPTVRPPSRMAKRMCCSIAIGVISSTSIEMLSPGITISTPSGSVTLPVTSVVRK